MGAKPWAWSDDIHMSTRQGFRAEFVLLWRTVDAVPSRCPFQCFQDVTLSPGKEARYQTCS